MQINQRTIYLGALWVYSKYFLLYDENRDHGSGTFISFPAT